jgi:hypothetical protein
MPSGAFSALRGNEVLGSVARPASAQRVRQGPPAASPQLGRLSGNVFERVGVKVGELPPPFLP